MNNTFLRGKIDLKKSFLTCVYKTILKDSYICVCVYMYIYIVLFGPVKPELGVIPSGQKKTIQQWTFKFSW